MIPVGQLLKILTTSRPISNSYLFFIVFFLLSSQQLAFSDNEENEKDSSKKDARKDRNDKNRGKDEDKIKDKPEIDRRSVSPSF